MSLKEIPYDRDSAVTYAREWAYARNKQYYDFSKIGGDCTNYASQSVYVGCKIMNFTPTYGWYYINVNDRAPAWTSVEYIYKFLTTNEDVGPYAIDVDISMIEAGDLVQIRFLGESVFGHTPVIIRIDGEKILENIYIAAHSVDCDCRLLSTYNNVIEMRFLHILGARYREI
ncbi:MAG: amidase domain-containing protein [Oscillospiraceae bacterium]